jgi:hypothetical protein
MKAVVKLVGVVVILAWAISWPTHAKASSGYKCNADYSECMGQCESNMGQCTQNCNNQNPQAEYCYETLTCWQEDGYLYCITDDDCFYAPGSGCMQNCVNTINQCANGCLSGDCVPCTGTGCE